MKKIKVEKAKIEGTDFTRLCRLTYMKNSPYIVLDDETIIAYKIVKEDYSSFYQPSTKYEVGESYTADCDYDMDNYNSNGLSAWTRNGALNFHRTGRLLVVAIDIDNIGVLLSNGKIRCSSLEVIVEVSLIRAEKYVLKIDGKAHSLTL